MSQTSDSTKPQQRIAKFLAHAGVCSRREAEQMIAAGKVTIDGKVITSPALNVTGQNIIEIDGVIIKPRESTDVWIYHKPKGEITSNKDPQGRATVFDNLPKDMPRVVSIGRLDYNTEGLLILTNNGEFARHLEHPQNAIKRTYRVRVIGHVTQGKLDSLKNGITIDGLRYGKIDITVEQSSSGRNKWLTMSIWEGKNREIRKICEHIGLTVNRLIRVSYGELELGSLPIGKVKKIPDEVVQKLI